jgi:type I restriction enzyme S subunit
VCRTNGSISLIGKAALVRNPFDRPTAFASYLLRFRLRESESLPLWVYWYFSSRQARRFIESNAASSAGQHNISMSLMRGMRVPAPPAAEQRRIIERLEELLSDLDAGVAALKRAGANLRRYRAAVLKGAVEGSLTEEWRAVHPDGEPASKLLERILAERRRKWEAEQLARFEAAGKAPPKDWQRKYVEPASPDASALSDLPKSWCWARMDQLISFLKNGYFQSPSPATEGHRILRINAVRPMQVNLAEVRYLPSVDTAASEYLIGNGDLLFTRYNRVAA